MLQVREGAGGAVGAGGREELLRGLLRVRGVRRRAGRQVLRGRGRRELPGVQVGHTSKEVSTNFPSFTDGYKDLSTQTTVFSRTHF